MIFYEIKNVLAPSSILWTLRLSGQVKLMPGRCLREVRALQISFFSPSGAWEGLTGKLHMNRGLSGQAYGQEKQHHPTWCISFHCRQISGRNLADTISHSTTNLRKKCFPPIKYRESPQFWLNHYSFWRNWKWVISNFSPFIGFFQRKEKFYIIHFISCVTLTLLTHTSETEKGCLDKTL